MTVEERQALFQNPSREYRAKPFWSWNGKLEEEEIKRQSDVMEEMGFGGYFMHSRTGLETEYLGEEWFDLINACADHGASHGMETWLYDEDRWPSGSAGGLATENAKYRAMYLEMNLYGDTQWENAIHDGGNVAVFGCMLQDGIFTEKRELRYGDILKQGETAVSFRIRYSELKDNYNGYCYLNTMSREATEHFLKITHEQYRKKCGKRLGKEIVGVFTDEPHRGGLFTNFADGQPNAAPYTLDLFEEFEKRFGYDLRENLPELFLRRKADDVSKVKRDYLELCQELFLENFAVPYMEWCQKNHMLFTGHVLHENSLSNQTIMQGSLMRFYEYMDYPGIDFLGEWEECYWIAKQVDSVARQFGKQKVLSEMYAFTGWQTNFSSYKNIGDWQAFFGVNLRCPHLSWYTMKGQCKRDYPASILHQSGWYPQYHYVEDYFSRIHVALQDMPAMTGLLVLNPVESVWARVYSGAFERLEGIDPQIRRLEEQYAETFRMLQGARIDFDYGEEDIMERHGEVRNGKLWIKNCCYDKVLISGMDIMRKSTLKLLETFVKAGGEVIFAGELPGYVDALPSEEIKEFANCCTRVPFEQKALAKACGSGFEIGVNVEDEEKIYARTFGNEKERMVMILNMDRKRGYEALTIDFGEGTFVEQWNPRTGEVVIPDYERKEQRIFVKTNLEEGGERLYRITEEQRNLCAAKACAAREELSMGDTFRYRLTEPNICVLDKVKVTCREDFFMEEKEVIKADRSLRDHLGFPYRGGNMLQPWYQKKYHVGKYDAPNEVSLCYSLEAQVIPGMVTLVVEDLEHIQKILINGNELKLCSIGHWIDRCFDELQIPDEYWKYGQNEIVLKMEYEMSSGIEAVYLLGDFGVSLKEDHTVLTVLPEMLQIGDISDQGLPFYSGSVIYEIEGMKDTAAEVEVSDFGGALIQLRGESKKGTVEKIIAFAPYREVIENLTEIQVVLTRRNTFGPFHMKEKYAAEIGPLSFITEGENWTDSYVLFEQGLLAKPVIYKEKRSCES